MSDLTPFEYVTELLEELGGLVLRRGPSNALAQCPAHYDDNPSLSITEGDSKGKPTVLLHCFACGDESGLMVAHQLGLSSRSLFDTSALPEPAEQVKILQAEHLTPTFPTPRVTKQGRHRGNISSDQWSLEAEHTFGGKWRLMRYRHSSGTKQVRWETLSDGRWVSGRVDVPQGGLPLYRVEEASESSDPIVIVESESSVDALWDAGITAVTWAGGAVEVKTYLPALANLVQGRNVIIVPDLDEAGELCGQRLLDVLEDYAARCDVVRVTDWWPEAGRGADARDLLEHIGTRPFLIGTESSENEKTAKTNATKTWRVR